MEHLQNSTYSSLQYVLTNNKIENFPIPQKKNIKLSINLVPAQNLDAFKDLKI